MQIPDDPATAEIAVTVVDNWQRREADTALVSALMERPPAVTRLRAVVEAGNHASLALLARTGRMSPGSARGGVVDVTVDLPAASQPRSAVEMVADLWAHGAREFADQAYLFLRLPQAGLIPAVEGYVEIVARMAK